MGKLIRKGILACAAAAIILSSGCEREGAAAPSIPQASDSGQTSQPTGGPASAPEISPSPGSGPDMAETGMPKEEPVPPSSSRRESALKPIYSVGKDSVAITIDDGPTKDTDKLLKVLKKLDAPVTFFFLGQHVEKYHESVSQAVYDKHGIGYHSDKHPQMVKMSYEDQEKEYNSGLKKLEKYTKQPVKLFRPPYGSYNNDTKLIVEEHKMSMVLWNEDPKDWESSDAASISKKVLAEVRSGSVIVMHDHPSTIEALPAIIEGIRKKGFKLVTIPTS